MQNELESLKATSNKFYTSLLVIKSIWVNENLAKFFVEVNLFYQYPVELANVVVQPFGIWAFPAQAWKGKINFFSNSRLQNRRHHHILFFFLTKLATGFYIEKSIWQLISSFFVSKNTNICTYMYVCC